MQSLRNSGRDVEVHAWFAGRRDFFLTKMLKGFYRTSVSSHKMYLVYNEVLHINTACVEASHKTLQLRTMLKGQLNTGKLIRRSA